VTFWTDLTKLSKAQLGETAWWLRWYRLHRGDLAGLVYEDTGTDPIDGRASAAFQPWYAGHGYLFAFRQGGGQSTQTIALQGLVADARYRLTNVRTGVALGTFAGAQLERGVPLTLARPYSAEVLTITLS
jgi:hypothetical protein